MSRLFDALDAVPADVVYLLCAAVLVGLALVDRSATWGRE